MRLWKGTCFCRRVLLSSSFFLSFFLSIFLSFFFSFFFSHPDSCLKIKIFVVKNISAECNNLSVCWDFCATRCLHPHCRDALAHARRQAISAHASLETTIPLHSRFFPIVHIIFRKVHILFQLLTYLRGIDTEGI